jgi:uncharacterized protein (DUF924 family)
MSVACDPDDVLREWFRDPERWWRKDPAFDTLLRERFGECVEAGLRGELDGWAETSRGALALVVLLDQLTRNIHRDTPRMYAGDEKALATCLELIETGDDLSLSDDERHFLYMPLMHGEDPELQRRSLEQHRTLGRGLDHAEQHAQIVFRFGRFPHRNAILGRPSTEEEIGFLEQPGSSF